jgi:hypothetical protein
LLSILIPLPPFGTLTEPKRSVDRDVEPVKLTALINRPLRYYDATFTSSSSFSQIIAVLLRFGAPHRIRGTLVSGVRV